MNNLLYENEAIATDCPAQPPLWEIAKYKWSKQNIFNKLIDQRKATI